jgi:hypothetical protein
LDLIAKLGRPSSISGISMTAFGVAVLIGAAGCTRTSDGSYVMRKPAMFSRLAMFGDKEAEVAPRSPAIASPPYANTQAAPTAPRARPQRQAKITGPSLSLIKNPPFKRTDPSKPISCRNESTTGRIRVVCS